MNFPLILASTSKYRRLLLERLGLEFACVSPNVNEDDFKQLGLAPQELAETLARKKAESVQNSHHNAVVIGGDQLVSFQGTILGKPGSHEGAIQQLEMMSGKRHELITSICAKGSTFEETHTDIAVLTFRSLTSEEIERYVSSDRPFDCAGSYKIEEHGITLFERIESEDHSAITGLPLIKLTSILRTIGYQVP